MTRTWILVADSARARLFELKRSDSGMLEIEDRANPEGRMAGREMQTDRAARSQESTGRARHAIEPRTDLHEQATTRFARELAAVLERGRIEHRYDELILVAPPRFLGRLNVALGRQVRMLVAGELDKELTGLDARSIQAQLPVSPRRKLEAIDAAVRAS